MDNLLDDAFNEKPLNSNQVVFATFWSRVWASLIDALIIMPIVLPLMFYNMSTWKNVLILIAVIIVPPVYKVFMEYTYGATWGKMAQRIVVVNYDFEKPSLETILLRNIVGIATAAATFLSTLYVFSLDGFKEVTGFIEYTTFMEQNNQVNTVNNVMSLVSLIDVLMMLSDKQNRTYHDKIGKTYVVKRSSLAE
jgi:uncharacterized RDD family membrane protein YckC